VISWPIAADHAASTDRASCESPAYDTLLETSGVAIAASLCNALAGNARAATPACAPGLQRESCYEIRCRSLSSTITSEVNTASMPAAGASSGIALVPTMSIDLTESAS
jgi:hypothetical protein